MVHFIKTKQQTKQRSSLIADTLAALHLLLRVDCLNMTLLLFAVMHFVQYCLDMKCAYSCFSYICHFLKLLGDSMLLNCAHGMFEPHKLDSSLFY